MWLAMRFDHVVEAIHDSRNRMLFDVDVDGPMGAALRPLLRLQYQPNMSPALDTLAAEAERLSR